MAGRTFFAAATVAAALASPPAQLRGWIVYWSQSPFPSIWAVRGDGTGGHRILDNRQNAKRPRLSPDRQWVAFDGTPPGEQAMSDFDIQLVRLDGTDLHTLTNTPEWDVDAQWSRDGRWLTFTRSPPSPTDCRSSAVWVIRPDGSDPREVARGCSPRWSPDGTRLAYVEQTDVFAVKTVGVDGTGVRTLLSTRDAERVNGWSPNGKRILYTRSYDQNGRSAGIFTVGVDGSGVRKLGRGFAACWSPDGAKVLYTLRFEGPIWVMKANGTQKRPVVSTLALEPDWR